MVDHFVVGVLGVDALVVNSFCGDPLAADSLGWTFASGPLLMDVRFHPNGSNKPKAADLLLQDRLSTKPTSAAGSVYIVIYIYIYMYSARRS